MAWILDWQPWWISAGRSTLSWPVTPLTPESFESTNQSVNGLNLGFPSDEVTVASATHLPIEWELEIQLLRTLCIRMASSAKRFQRYHWGWVLILSASACDSYFTLACKQFTSSSREYRHHCGELSFVMDIKLRALLDRCSEEEREVIERWFKNFQAIELSKLNGISIARGASITCPLYQWWPSVRFYPE